MTIVTILEESRVELARMQKQVDDTLALNRKLLKFQGDVTQAVALHGSLSATMGRPNQ
ncbi:MAG: hypothetical protein AAB466_10485 [Verrucomicrobiota bacterium]